MMKFLLWWWQVLSRSLLIVFLLPFLSLILPAGSESEQAKLDCVIAKIERLEAACDDPELKDILGYTARRYNRIGRGGVAVRPMWYAAGINVPWCPGVTIDAECWGYCVDTVVTILVHEAQHDYPPYAGHGHIGPVELKLYRLMMKVE